VTAVAAHRPSIARIHFVATLVLLGSLCLVGPAYGQLAAPFLVISSGNEDGNYYRMASRIQAQLSAGYQKFAEVLTSHGSFENLARLDDPSSPVAVTFAQADALNAYIAKNPGFAREFSVLADLGNECVFLLTGRKSGIKSFADLKSGAGQKIAVGHREGGPAVTYGYMTQLEPALENSRPLYIDVMESMLLLKRGESAPNVKAAMVVQRPHILSPALELALEDPEDFRVIQIRPGELQSTSLPDGSNVYTYEKITLRGSPIATLCTRGLLLTANKKIDEKKLAILSSLLLNSLQEIAPGAR
jgi:hypothetical protein